MPNQIEIKTAAAPKDKVFFMYNNKVTIGHVTYVRVHISADGANQTKPTVNYEYRVEFYNQDELEQKRINTNKVFGTKEELLASL